MTQAQQATFAKMAKRYTEIHTQTRAIARKNLVDEGIHLANGKLAPEYGGKPSRKDAATRR